VSAPGQAPPSRPALATCHRMIPTSISMLASPCNYRFNRW